MECEVKIKTRINATENPRKVLESVLNIFPKIEIKETDNLIQGGGGIEVLEELRESLEERRIRSTARKILYENRIGLKTTFYLNKQAAFIGKVNILEEEISPLGDIKVELISENLKEVIDWLAPKIEDEPQSN
ncbi:RNA-binding domain-containing protein [Methanothermobacter tenebrarum]|uniref:UPF0201 protein DPC56_05035 n=1 Tax=Methanothermobacter tenebrarum TaxID=680118 RepID=A0A328PH74_9EURY|nr:RNA-binding domain-containing protein [Methanothermobacter tenebrarum]MBC7118502.1 hypothetical protein [Methanobacteriaceae archaeon]NPV64671.1 hypothetical protein [Methanobacteriaceae archaeon]RAO79006.1 hypothetical protein DPC56_05035 [Methanothermobacter tenebrarum]